MSIKNPFVPFIYLLATAFKTLKNHKLGIADIFYVIEEKV